jgi:hypothetical protein
LFNQFNNQSTNMKAIFILFSILIGLGIQAQSTIEIPGKKDRVLEYDEYEKTEVTLKCTCEKDVMVAVLDKRSGEQLRGFGLASNGKATINVEETSVLVLRNTSRKPAEVEVKTSEHKPKKTRNDLVVVNFTLRNSSNKSIPLWIPNVMNPNLSPMSNSGVNLKYGQKIFFKENGKKYLLLVVNENIQKGQKIDVPELISQRKEELGI